MKTPLLSVLSVLGSATLLCSCGSMQPDSNLQKVVSGDIFGGKPTDMRQEKRMEDAAREEYLTMPRNYSVDKETEDTNGRIGFNMPL